MRFPERRTRTRIVEATGVRGTHLQRPRAQRDDGRPLVREHPPFCLRPTPLCHTGHRGVPECSSRASPRLLASGIEYFFNLMMRDFDAGIHARPCAKKDRNRKLIERSPF